MIFLYNIFLTYQKITKDSIAKYHKKTKKDCKIKLVKDINTYLKKKKEKSVNIVVNVMKISQKIKNRLPEYIH